MRAVYWAVGVTAVALVAGVWFRLIGTIVPGTSHPAETATLQDPAVPDATPAAPAEPSAGVLALRERLPQYEKRANSADFDAIKDFYADRNGPLVWVLPDGFTPKAKAAIAEIARAGDWGLDAKDYALPRLPVGALTPETGAGVEIELTLAMLKYARNAYGGRIAQPSRVSSLFDQTPPRIAPKTVLSALVSAEAPDAYLRSLHPRHGQFLKLRELLVRLRRQLDPSPSDDIAFGAQLQGTVAELQTASTSASPPAPPSRAPTGAERLRIEADIDRILVNMERWRWLPHELGSIYVWNNVPEFMTRVWQDGKIINSDRIVAGQPDWPTPVFSADMKSIVFHPSWGVPDGIKRKELAPLLRRSSSGGLVSLFTGAPSAQSVLAAHKLQAYYNGRQIDPNGVNWSSANISAYEFRQPPGPTNVLGEVKFLFPNKHDVYMHDTPDRSLFARDFRGLSHGCMRVGDPRRFAEVLLSVDKSWSKEKVQSMFRAGTQEVALSRPIPVHNTYFTAMVDYQGNLREFGDLYGLDPRLGRALLAREPRFKSRSYAAEVAAIEREERQKQQRLRASSSGASTLADAISDIFSP